MKQTQSGFELPGHCTTATQLSVPAGHVLGGGGGEAASQRQVFVFSTCPDGHATHWPPQHV
jgi:hypothetical protein